MEVEAHAEEELELELVDLLRRDAPHLRPVLVRVVEVVQVFRGRHDRHEEESLEVGQGEADARVPLLHPLQVDQSHREAARARSAVLRHAVQGGGLGADLLRYKTVLSGLARKKEWAGAWAGRDCQPCDKRRGGEWRSAPMEGRQRALLLVLLVSRDGLLEHCGDDRHEGLLARGVLFHQLSEPGVRHRVRIRNHVYRRIAHHVHFALVARPMCQLVALGPPTQILSWVLDLDRGRLLEVCQLELGEQVVDVVTGGVDGPFRSRRLAWSARLFRAKGVEQARRREL